MLTCYKQFKAKNIIVCFDINDTAIAFGNHFYTLHAEAVIASVAGCYGQAVFKLHLAGIVIFYAYICHAPVLYRGNADRLLLIIEFAYTVYGIVKRIAEKGIDISRAPAVEHLTVNHTGKPYSLTHAQQTFFREHHVKRPIAGIERAVIYVDSRGYLFEFVCIHSVLERQNFML